MNVQYLSANTTAQFSDSLRGRFAYNNSWAKTTGLLPALAGTEPTGTNYGLTRRSRTTRVSGNLDWVASPKLFFGVRGGYYFSDVNDTNVTEQPRYVFQTGNNLTIPGVPDRPAQANRVRVVPGRRVLQEHARPADACLLPGRRHGLRQPGGSAPGEVRHAGRSPRRTTC